jgi:hypothetical protein
MYNALEKNRDSRQHASPQKIGVHTRATYGMPHADGCGAACVACTGGTADSDSTGSAGGASRCIPTHCWQIYSPLRPTGARFLKLRPGQIGTAI